MVTVYSHLHQKPALTAVPTPGLSALQVDVPLSWPLLYVIYVYFILQSPACLRTSFSMHIWSNLKQTKYSNKRQYSSLLLVNMGENRVSNVRSSRTKLRTFWTLSTFITYEDKFQIIFITFTIIISISLTKTFGIFSTLLYKENYVRE